MERGLAKAAASYFILTRNIQYNSDSGYLFLRAVRVSVRVSISRGGSQEMTYAKYAGEEEECRTEFRGRVI